MLINFGFALESNDDLSDPEINQIETTDGSSKKFNSFKPIVFPEYQIEVLIFKNNQLQHKPYKEIFTQQAKVINQVGGIDFNDKYVKPRLLLKSYDKIMQNSNYKILFYAATSYNILPSQKSKKFFITSSKQNVAIDDIDHQENFNIILTIFRLNKNNFNLVFNGHLDHIYSLNRSAKIKPKEVYYFDHPMFGALVTLMELNKDK